VLSGQGYWPSYNVPSDPFIFNISGQQELVDKHGGVTGAGAFFPFLNTSRRTISTAMRRASSTARQCAA
jgi:hypothetical protein